MNIRQSIRLRRPQKRFSISLILDILLIDEKKGRAIATQLGLNITGILGILIEAKRQNHVAEIKPIITTLTEKAGVWFKPDLIKEVLTRVNEI